VFPKKDQAIDYAPCRARSLSRPSFPVCFKTSRPKCGKHSGPCLFLVLRRAHCLPGGYAAEFQYILGDFGNHPGFWSSLQEHIGFHDLATDWPQ
jgi:hypothetical protein